MGATGGSTSSQYPKAMNALIGTKFKIILGYPGGNDINLAMERGEVAVRGSNSWGAWKSTRPDWLRDNKINILVQIGLEKARRSSQRAAADGSRQERGGPAGAEAAVRAAQPSAGRSSPIPACRRIA